MIITREHRTKPYPLGVRVVGDGLEVAVYSETADAVDLCVFDDSGRETAHRLPERSGHVFHGRIDGHGVGTRYGLRVTGAWDPANGLKGFTQIHPDVPEEIRGTYAGLAHPASIAYLTELGVTAVELIPVQQFAQDSHLLEKGLRNYWGYNTIAFFAPNADYSALGDGGQQVVEFKRMVTATRRTTASARPTAPRTSTPPGRATA